MKDRFRVLAIQICMVSGFCLVGCSGSYNPPDSVYLPPSDNPPADFLSKVSSPLWPISAWSEKGLHVAKNGANQVSCGTKQSPCLTIKYALTLVQPGDTVYVHQGLYVENQITPPSKVRLLATDGPLTARIFAGTKRGLFIYNVDTVEINGFEIDAEHNGGTSKQDGLIRILDAKKIVIRNSVVHDAPINADVIKISVLGSRVEDILLENVIAYNTADPTEEVIDIYGSQPMIPPAVRNVVMRNCWLFDGQYGSTYLTYAKVNVENILYEGNIFGPFKGGVGLDTALSVGTVGLSNVSPTTYANQHTVVRNNIFIGHPESYSEGGLGITNADDVWVYNNVFYKNSGPTTDSVILLDGIEMSPGRVRIFNNVFQDNFPASRKHGHVYWVREKGMPRALFRQNNLYFNNTPSSNIDYSREAGTLYIDPLFRSTPAIPNTFTAEFHPTLETLSSLVDSFRFSVNSPTRGNGLHPFSMESYPNWFPGLTDIGWDILWKSRSQSDAWSLGPFE